jgi:ATP-dependent DNA helicase RecQ
LFLQSQGYPVRYYHAGLSEERVALERQLLRNELKALACTNALGMGLDKPDLRFVIHYETPASPIHYYQEIGRDATASNRTVSCSLIPTTSRRSGR